MKGQLRLAGWVLGGVAAFAAGGPAAADSKLVVKSAVIKDAKANGYGWDVIGSPDPYVKAAVVGGTAAGRTRHLADTLEPDWDETVLTVNVGDEVALEVWDKDFAYDDLIGEYKFTVTSEMAKGGEVKVGFGQVKELRFVVGGAAPAEDAKTTAARRFVEGEQKLITVAMHPTSTHQKAQFDGAEVGKSGLTLRYTYRYSHLLQSEFTSQMEYTFDAKGRFTGLSVGKTTAYVEPFVGSDVALTVLKEVVAAEVGLVADSGFKKALDAADAQTVLQLYLTFKSRQK